MKVEKVLLINCTLDKHSRAKIHNVVSSPNLGLLSIAGVLIMHGYDVKILDFFADSIKKEQYKKILEEFNPDVIGYSVYTRTVPFLRRMVELNKKIGYEGITVVGGPHPSFNEREMLDDIGADFVIKGEGEFTFLKLLESLKYPVQYPISRVKGISYRIKNDIYISEKIEYIENLDALPLQAIGIIDPEKYSTAFTLITSRGCPGNCVYCASRALSGNKYRMRSAENIICEIYFLSEKLNSRKFLILDDTFTANKERLEYFCLLLSKYNEKYAFRIESRVDAVREKDIDALKKVGCEVIHFGVESGSQEIIKKIGKNINLSWAKEIMCYANKQNIHVVASFIIGHFCDTERTIQETISLMEILRNSGIEVSVAGCVPFPGTPLYEHTDKLGISIHAHSWQEYDFSNMIISTSYLSQEQLRELLFSAVTKIS